MGSRGNIGPARKFKRYSKLSIFTDNLTIKEKIMKKIKRYVGNFKCKSEEITEQEYVDKEFESLRSMIKELEEEIQVLNTLNIREHIFITPEGQQYYEEDKLWLISEEGRKHLRKKGYIYIKTFENHGELWVKEEAK